MNVSTLHFFLSVNTHCLFQRLKASWINFDRNRTHKTSKEREFWRADDRFLDVEADVGMAAFLEESPERFAEFLECTGSNAAVIKESTSYIIKRGQPCCYFVESFCVQPRSEYSSRTTVCSDNNRIRQDRIKLPSLLFDPQILLSLSSSQKGKKTFQCDSNWGRHKYVHTQYH